ncbi:MAG: TIGR04282 family arsenosugar biosynthesis glycosyltransferase [Hyphomicrobiales bacterium]|nr:TIGR04282 family arsenosugar biosynthesis glycosyltransferase [Hyphomicrobiales bacterium]
MNAAGADPSGACGIAVMAKASMPGRTKTRLVPPLTFEEAAALNTVFLKDAFANIGEASRSTPIVGFAAYGPTGEEPFFENLTDAPLRLIPATYPNFGDCLLAGIDGIFSAGCSSACVLNADTPDLPSEYLVRTARELAGGRDRVVIGPTDDGGYYILGISKAHRRLFAEIDWSTERVFAQTLERIAELELEVVTLPRWSDIDDAQSLLRFANRIDGIKTEFGARPFAAPHSREHLRNRFRDSDLAHRLAPSAEFRVDAA